MNKNIPNYLTILRIVMTPFLIYLTYINSKMALYAFILISITDFLDGYIARKYNLISNFGKIFDPMADKIMVFGVLITQLLQYNYLLIPTLIMLGREFLVTSIRMILIEKNIVVAADKLGKIKTVLQIMMIICIYIIPFNFITYIIVFLATILSLLSGYNYIEKNKENIF